MEKSGSDRVVSRRSALAVLGGGGIGLILAAHDGVVAAQDATPSTSPVVVERDITYGTVDGHQLQLDVFRPPAQSTLRPAVVLFHPGAWTFGMGDRTIMEPPALALAAAGYVAFNVEYRLTGDPSGHYAWPDQLDDAQRAVRWVRANAAHYGINPAHVGSYGHSAGAHLAAMLGVRETRMDSDPVLAGISSRVFCVVALAGHFDLTIPYPQAVDQRSVADLLCGTPTEVPNAYRDASPLTWVDKNSAPFLVIHGGADDKNPVTHARRMVDALHAAEVETIYAELPAGTHFTVAEWPIAGPWTVTFLDVLLDPNG